MNIIYSPVKEAMVAFEHGPLSNITMTLTTWPLSAPGNAISNMSPVKLITGDNEPMRLV